MRWMLLIVFVFAGSAWAEELEIKRRDPVETFWQGYLEYGDLPSKTTQERSKAHEYLEQVMRAYALAINIEDTRQHLSHPIANAESNYKQRKLTAETRRFCNMTVVGVQRHSDGEVTSLERDEEDEHFTTMNIGNVRLVFNSPAGYTGSSTGSAGNLLLNGWRSERSFGFHGGGRADCLRGFAEFCEGDTTWCLFNKTPLVIRGGVMRVAGKYFKLDGRKTTVFMYDDNSIDKIIVE